MRRRRGRLSLAAERRVTAKGRLDYCASKVRAMLMLESCYGEKGKPDFKYKGEMQEIFRHWGSVRPSDADDETKNNRLLSSEFVKLFKETPGVLGPTLNNNDLELVFAKLKTHGAKHLEYEQFVEALDMVCASVHPTVREFPEGFGKKFRGRNARMLKLVYDNMFRTKWSKKFTKQLDKRTAAYCDRKATKLQALVRGVDGRKRYRVVLAAHLAELERRERERASSSWAVPPLPHALPRDPRREARVR